MISTNTQMKLNNKVHGWICMDPLVGFRQITPSDEFRSGGLLVRDR